MLTFVVILAGLGGSVLNARRAEASSRFIAEATTLALDKVEHLRTLLLVHPDAAPGNHLDPSNPLGSDGTNGGIYNRTWRVTQDVPLVGMRRAEVSVSWNDRNGGPGSVTLVAYLGLL